MGSAFYSLAKAAMDDLIDWHCWHRPTTDDVFRGACHACFFWTAVRILNLQALRKHEARARREHGSRGLQRGVHLQASVHHYRNDLQRRRKSLTLCPTS